MKQALLFGFLLVAGLLQAKTNTTPNGFIENKGQIIDQNNNLNPSVKYLWAGNGMKVQLKGNSFSYEVLKTEKFQYKNSTSLRAKRSVAKQSKLDCFVPRSDGEFEDSTVIYSHRIDIELLNANPNPELKAEGQSDDYLNYYTTGTPEAGVNFVHQYNKITYQNIYPNIDLEFVLDAANKQPFKYNFIVRPGGRVSDIQLQYNGANSTELTMGGSLNIATSYGNLEENIPSSYIAETGKDITVQYQQNHEGVYGFSAGNYNGQQTLVIDPWATYYGGSQNDMFIGVGTDSTGFLYVAGATGSTNNIATSGTYQTSLSSTLGDAMVVKFNAKGVRIWGTYFGGNNGTNVYDFAVSKIGESYITGFTNATDIATTGSYQSTYAGNQDAYIAKFNALGLRLWSTYFGGNNSDNIQGITIGMNNEIFISGVTNSPNSIASIGGYQTVLGGNNDAFIAKFSSLGVRLWSTYFGGNNDEDGWGITVDNIGNVIATGVTNSSNGVATASAFQSSLIGAQNAYICKFNTSGALQWSTYYGNSNEFSHNLITDNNNNIYFVGSTTSTSGFATSGAYQSIINSGADGYVAKFNSMGSRIWVTYFGGESDNEEVSNIGIDSFNNIYITGYTSSATNITSSGSFQLNIKGQTDAFLAKFNINGIRLWSTYFGGNHDESAVGICKNTNKKIVIAGVTSSDSNVATINAFQTSLNGSSDGFIGCFDTTGHFTPDGISDLSHNTELLIKIYPNPATNKITVSIKDYTGKDGSISILSLEGKLIKHQSIKTEETNVELSGLPSGTYLLQYDDGEVCETMKFLKE